VILTTGANYGLNIAVLTIYTDLILIIIIIMKCEVIQGQSNDINE